MTKFDPHDRDLLPVDLYFEQHGELPDDEIDEIDDLGDVEDLNHHDF